MAPRKQTAAATPAPAQTAVASTAMKTVSGFAVGLTAFIPVDPKDLRRQAEIPLLLLDIQEGKKTIADLTPFLRQVEFRQQHTRKRVTEEEFNELFDIQAEPASDEEAQVDGDDDDNGGDIGSVDGEGYGEGEPDFEEVEQADAAE